MNEVLDELRRNDPKQLNLEGVVDFDCLMFRIFSIVRLSINNNMELFKALFSAFDINDDDSLDVKEILDVYKIIEAEHGVMNSKEI